MSCAVLWCEKKSGRSKFAIIQRADERGGCFIDRARPRSARPSRHDVDLAERDEFSDDVRDVQRHPDERDANLHRGRVQGRRAGATAIRPDPLARCRIRQFRARAPPIRSILRSSAPSIESNRIESIGRARVSAITRAPLARTPTTAPFPDPPRPTAIAARE
eukprot:31126-Pelagococcus_subviridis.AAC.11